MRTFPHFRPMLFMYGEGVTRSFAVALYVMIPWSFRQEQLYRDTPCFTKANVQIGARSVWAAIKVDCWSSFNSCLC